MFAHLPLSRTLQRLNFRSVAFKHRAPRSVSHENIIGDDENSSLAITLRLDGWQRTIIRFFPVPFGTKLTPFCNWLSPFFLSSTFSKTCDRACYSASHSSIAELSAFCPATFAGLATTARTLMLMGS
eukprot:Gregarina_sp_Poly_1__108@NODE_1023_length_5325_cov_19_407950_g713_i0_p2_GENE_NODE_1023_length_5325_cov_19_407950_g713_i0NODE_1023_length_5325_cov_19_407950_g713_i0_p2_ORF_typecomplete_len127_score5_11LETM1/PF07766_13/0_12_NODE_1023_length_5325_cov_19_407950_g713_i0287667